MKVIHKVTLNPLEVTTVSLKKDTGEPLTAAMQDGKPTLWYLLDTDDDSENVDRYFYGAGTGQPIPSEFKRMNFIGTCSSTSSPYIWHVFEVFK